MASALFSERMWKEQPPSFSTQKPKCDIFFYTYLSGDGFCDLPWINNLPQPVQTTPAAPRPSSLNAWQASLENSRLLPSADLLSLSFFLSFFPLLLALLHTTQGSSVAHLYYWRFHPKWGMNGWMNTWMDDSNNHPHISWRFHRQWGMDGCRYVWIRGGKFIHPQIWWESQGK